MNKYLIIYGQDNSFFYTMASSFADAFLEFAKYIGSSLPSVFDKALKAMDTPSEIIELYNHLCAGYETIQTVYKIGSILYSVEKERAEICGGDTNDT